MFRACVTVDRKLSNASLFGTYCCPCLSNLHSGLATDCALVADVAGGGGISYTPSAVGANLGTARCGSRSSLLLSPRSRRASLARPFSRPRPRASQSLCRLPASATRPRPSLFVSPGRCGTSRRRRPCRCAHSQRPNLRLWNKGSAAPHAHRQKPAGCARRVLSPGVHAQQR